MITKRIYVCENSIEGIFTGIYDAWASRYGHENIKIQVDCSYEADYNLELFSEYIQVKTDHEKAVKVAASIKEKISAEAYDMVSQAALSDSLDKGDIIYRFLILGFSIGSDVVNEMWRSDVMNLFTLFRNVANEVHHYLGFLRFMEVKGNILLAKIQPKNDIIQIMAPHFSDRLSPENFIIYDEKRKTCIVHPKSCSWIYIIDDNFEVIHSLELSEREEGYQNLWKTFFETIAIEERENKKLQRNNLPIRFRSNMTEF